MANRKHGARFSNTTTEALVRVNAEPSPMAELVQKKADGTGRAVQDATKRIRAELITALGELAAARRRIAELEETIEIMREDVDS